MKDFQKKSLLYFVGGNIVNVLNYVFHVVTGRLLVPEEYGVLNALLALFFFLSIPSLAFQTVVTRQMSDHQTAPGRFVRFLKKEMILVGLLVTGLLLLITPVLQSWLHIDSRVLFVLLALTFGVTFLLSSYRGILQGLQRFEALSANMILESVLKLVIFVLLVLWGLRVEAAMWGLLVSICLCSVFFFFYKQSASDQDDSTALRSVFWKETNSIFWAFFFLTSFYTLDILLVRHLIPQDSGIYALVTKFGQLVFFANHLLISVFFSYQSSHRSTPDQTRQSIGAIVLFSGLAALGYWLLQDFLVGVLFGDQYLTGAQYLWISALTMGALSINNFLMHHFLALRSYTFFWGFGAMLISTIVGIYLFHDSLWQIFGVILAHQILLIIINFFLAAKSHSPKTS